MVVWKVSMISIFYSYLYFIFPYCLSTYIYILHYHRSSGLGFLFILIWEWDWFWARWNDLMGKYDDRWDMNVCLRIMASYLLGLGLGLVLVSGIESDLGAYELTGFLVLWADLTVLIVLLYYNNSNAIEYLHIFSFYISLLCLLLLFTCSRHVVVELNK